MNRITKLQYILEKYASKLNKEYLNSLSDLVEKFQHIQENYTRIGVGGSRNTYLISSKKALKFAKSEKGIEQNKNEFSILSQINSFLLPKFYDHAPDFSWIEVELVRPLHNRNEIKELTDINKDDFVGIMFGLANNPELSYKDYLMKKIKQMMKFENENIDNIFFANMIENFKSYIGNPILEEIDKIRHIFNIDTNELVFPNLGKSASGHLALLDVGAIHK